MANSSSSGSMSDGQGIGRESPSARPARARAGLARPSSDRAVRRGPTSERPIWSAGRLVACGHGARSPHSPSSSASARSCSGPTGSRTRSSRVALMAEAVRGRRRRRRAGRGARGRLGPGRATCSRGATATRPGSWPRSSASTPRETVYTTGGGNTPQMLVNATAAEIQAGRARPRGPGRRRVAGAPGCGPGAPTSRSTWRKLPEGTTPTRHARRRRGDEPPGRSWRAASCMPVQVYPMFETALRAAAGEEPSTSTRCRSPSCGRGSRRWPPRNPYAWVQRALTRRGDPHAGPDNRMIGLPYPKYMNSNNDVDQAAALHHVLGRAGPRARRARGPLGVPARRRRLPRPLLRLQPRPTSHSTPAVRIGGRRALELAGVGIDDIERRRPLLVLPVGGADRRRGARARPRPPADPHRRPVVRRRARGTTT